jgi:hypothetical protein
MKRNMGAIRNQQIGLAPPNKFSSEFSKELVKGTNEMVAENKDVNTILREVQDATQKKMVQ